MKNGFLAEHAREHCVAITRALGVDYKIWAPPHGVELARLFLRKTGHFCGPCQVSMMNMYYQLARRHAIPLVLLGSSRRHDGAHPESANPWTPPFFEAVLRGEPDAEELRRDACEHGLLFRFGLATLTGRLRMLLVPDYVPWDLEANRQRLETRYGLRLQREHADCMAAPVADWIYKRRCGVGQASARLAAAIRNGRMSREAALQQLTGLDELGERFPLEEASDFLERVGMTEDDVVACAQREPAPYFDATFRAVGLARKLLRLSIA